MKEELAHITSAIPSPRAPFIGVARHRIPTDGEGVTTLAAFSLCPLQCAYCLNPQCASPDGALFHFTPQELLERVKVDDLYFQATGGGICFGGGEPCLRSDFIAQFHSLMPAAWHLYIETSLAVAPHHIETLAPLIDHWFIDVKDLQPDIYRRYTQQDITPLKRNLLRLNELGLQDRCTLRLPLIPDYNDEALRAESQRQLEEMGFSRFDLFEYVVRQKPAPTPTHKYEFSNSI
ncbi:MAG: radical SAM protein [Bacteroidales bacterium]|nr:radical SAM protein [Bacteroidales bacterium]